MTKRIVSGVLLLIALGALGLILAGALTSGEQLIVRFLTAIIVAAIGLYVISDLRLQADDQAAASRAGTASRRATTDSPPQDSTAAFMQTVTGKRSAQPVEAADTGAAGTDSTPADQQELATVGVDSLATGEATLELALDRSASSQAEKSEPPASDPGPILEATPPSDNLTPAAEPVVHLQDATPDTGPAWAPPADTEDPTSPYQADLDAAAQWPFNTETDDKPASTEGVEQEVDELVAIFARKTEQELAEQGLAKQELAEMGLADLDLAEQEQPRSPKVEAEPKPTAEPSAETVSAEATRENTSGAALIDGVGDFLNRGPELLDPEVGSPAEDEESASSGQHDSAPSTKSTGSNPLPKVSFVPPTKLAPAQAEGSELEKRDSIAPIIDLRTAHSAIETAATGGAAHPVSSVEELEAAIRSGELEVVSSLIEQELLSTEGPITDRDVSTMVYVAFTSSELRKILLAGGTLDSDLSDLDLGEVEVFVDPTEEEIEALQESAAMINLRAADLITADSQAL
jgi:hypothetical protein